MDKVNEHVIKLSGKASIPEGLSMGHVYRIQTDGEITAITESNNQDGTCNKYYKFSPIMAEIQGDQGEKIKAKDNRRMSQKIRNLLYKYWMNDDNKLDFDSAYENFGNQVLVEMENLYERSKK